LEKLDIHYDMARTIIEDILEYHLEFYLGVRDDEGPGDEFDDEDDELDDPDDGDDSDDAPPPKKGKGKNK